LREAQGIFQEIEIRQEGRQRPVHFHIRAQFISAKSWAKLFTKAPCLIA
jgi:hypothetical protein